MLNLLHFLCVYKLNVRSLKRLSKQLLLSSDLKDYLHLASNSSRAFVSGSAAAGPASQDRTLCCAYSTALAMVLLVGYRSARRMG
jgi:hypothetical protein